MLNRPYLLISYYFLYSFFFSFPECYGITQNLSPKYQKWIKRSFLPSSLSIIQHIDAFLFKSSPDLVPWLIYFQWMNVYGGQGLFDSFLPLPPSSSSLNSNCVQLLLSYLRYSHCIVFQQRHANVKCKVFRNTYG